MNNFLKNVFILILLSNSILFPAFELDLMVKLGYVGSFTDKTGEVLDPREQINLQLGYLFPVNKGVFKGVSLLADLGMNVGLISIDIPNNNYMQNRIGTIGFNTGLALKFLISASETRDIAIGVSSGVHFIPIIDDLNIKPSKVPMSPYVNFLLERRLYTADNRHALIIGIDIFYEYMFFDKSDINKLFAGYDINQHHSIGALFSIGYHFGAN